MLGRVLIVEDNIPYAQEACRKLRDLGCEVTTIPDPDMIAQAKNKADRQGVSILDAAQSALEKNRFDVSIVNLLLKAEDGSLLDEGDFLGEKVLEYVTNKYPGISCIVCTAYPPGRSTSFLDRYNVADIVYKNAIPARPDHLRAAVKTVLTQGHLVRRTIDGRSYELKGINSQIYRFLYNDGVMSRISHGITDYDNRLLKALGGDLPDERIREAVCLIADLWHLEPGLPRYPLIYKLGEMEFCRAFWEGHRDHLIHTLLVYLLGLYLYYGSTQIRTALFPYMSEEDFLRAWKIAALFHDLGYVFEIEFEKKGELYKQAFAELNDFRKRCLYHYCIVRGIPFLEAEDDKIRNLGEIFISVVDPDQIRTLSYLGNKDLFLSFESQALETGLGTTKDSLRRYWEYAMSHWTRDRKRNGYVDHGIAGALVLLQQYYSLQHYVGRAVPAIRRSRASIDKETAGLIVSLLTLIKEYKPAVEAAASAIALHYVDVDAWDHNDAFASQSLTLNKFRLHTQKTPLAFFLALVDALQSWDRPKYTMPKGADYAMQAQDVKIEFRDSKIVITYKADQYRGTKQSIFAHIVGYMSRYMRHEDLKLLLEEGDQP